jgi:hypothetical protein
MREQRRLSRLPHSRGEDAGVVAVGHPRQAGEEILQIDQRVFAVALARDDPGTPPYLAAFTPGRFKNQFEERLDIRSSLKH